MKKHILPVFLILAIISCENKSENNETMETIASETSNNSLEIGCYSYNGNNSSIELKINNIDKKVTGSLEYHLAEKDVNLGMFEGTLENNILFGTYIFQSEGVTGKRDVIFKTINGELIEGYGDMNENGTTFIDINKVHYLSNMPLEKTECNY